MIIIIIIIIIVIYYNYVYSVSNLVEYKIRMGVLSKSSPSGRTLLDDLFQFFLKLLFCFCLLDMRWNLFPFVDSPKVWAYLNLRASGKRKSSPVHELYPIKGNKGKCMCTESGIEYIPHLSMYYGNDLQQ